MSAFLSIVLAWAQSPAGMAAIAASLPKLLEFAASLNTKIAEAKAHGAGHDEAVQQAAQQVADIIARATAAAVAADAAHAADPTDKAFDPDVFREQP